MFDFTQLFKDIITLMIAFICLAFLLGVGITACVFNYGHPTISFGWH